MTIQFENMYYSDRCTEFGIWLDCAAQKIDPEGCGSSHKGAPHIVVADVAASIYADAIGCERLLKSGEMSLSTFEEIRSRHMRLAQWAHDISVKNAYNNTATRYLHLLKEMENMPV